MKQKDKVDAIVKRLYELKDDKYSYSLTEILKYLNLYESDEDMHRLATRLDENGLAKLTPCSAGVFIEIKNRGIDYYEENLSNSMSESGKLIAILKWLYPRRNEEGMCIKLETIMEELGIYESLKEAERLVVEMVEQGLVNLTPLADSAAFVHGITSKGIRFMNESPYINSGGETRGMQNTNNGIINMGTINAANLATGSKSHFQQTATFHMESQQLIEKIRKGIEANTEIDQILKQDLRDSVNDIEEKLQSKKNVPPYQWKALIGNTANLTQVAGFALQLAQLCGFQA